MLQTKNLSYDYNAATRLTFPDIHCQDGEHCLLLGASGCGKTTLLHLLGGLLSPKEGTVQVNDTILSQLSMAQLDKFRGKEIGIIFQKSHFVRALTVEENLLLAQQLAGVQPNKQRIEELLGRLNIQHKIKAKTSALSQGEQQRVAIARALVNQPAVILADEPTSALDDVNTEQVIQLLTEQATAVNATLLVVTHDNRLKGRFAKQILLQPQI